jgi:hypothetical protein
MGDEAVSPQVRMSAANALLDRGYGKPTEHKMIEQDVNLTEAETSICDCFGSIEGLIAHTKEQGISTVALEEYFSIPENRLKYYEAHANPADCSICDNNKEGKTEEELDTWSLERLGAFIACKGIPVNLVTYEM